MPEWTLEPYVRFNLQQTLTFAGRALCKINARFVTKVFCRIFLLAGSEAVSARFYKGLQTGTDYRLSQRFYAVRTLYRNATGSYIDDVCRLMAFSHHDPRL